MFLSSLQRGLSIVAILVSLITHAVASGLTVQVVKSQSVAAKVHLYNGDTPCRPEYVPQDSRSYNFDQCYKLDPFSMKEIQITEPAICANGSRARFTVFRSSFCGGFEPASTHVSNDFVGQCINVRSWWSFAFICDGIVQEEGPTFIDLNSWISPWTAFWLIAGTLFLALSLGTAFLFCGGFVMVMGGFGLLFWGFWSLGKGLVYLLKPRSQPKVD